MSGYWPSGWPCEDGGPERLQAAPAGAQLAVGENGSLGVRSRAVLAATMLVTRDPGELYLLRHTGGDQAVAFVEQLDPETLEPVGRSPDLPGGPAWPGSIAAHVNGSLYVVFGNHAHRLGPDLSVTATRTLPRPRPYNGFIVMADGCLVTKDFAGSRPERKVSVAERERCELIALEPDGLEVVDTCEMAEPSISRLSALGDTVYVVGDTSLLRVSWDGGFRPDDGFCAKYRVLDGQTYGWDAVMASGAAWFLDNGEGSERYDGSLRGHGVSSSPLHLVRVELANGSVSMTEVSRLPGGLVANPPLIDTARSIAVAYDSGNGVVQAFTIGADGSLLPRWRREQNHGGHMVLYPGAGQLVSGDHDRERNSDQVVVIDIETGGELARQDTGSPVQSVLFPATGFAGDLYLCSFTTVTRVFATP